jgi:hypothetical protein
MPHGVAAVRGSQAEAVPLIEATLEQAAAAGQGGAVTWAHWVAAILDNGLGRYQEAWPRPSKPPGTSWCIFRCAGIPRRRFGHYSSSLI